MSNMEIDDKAKEEYVEKYLKEVAANAAATTYTYDCQISMGAAGAGFVNVDFKKGGKTFAQFRGVPTGAVGGYTGWGKAWFNKPVEDLIDLGGAFTMEFVGAIGATCHMQITDAKTYIGNCSTFGVGIGAAGGPGGGKFVKYG